MTSPPLSAPLESVQALLDKGFTLACRTSDVPAMMPRRVLIQGYGLLICRHRMRFLALDELCPHRQKSMMNGLVMGSELICPHHQYHFDITTGRCLSHPCAALSTYETAVAEGAVFVLFPRPPAQTEAPPQTPLGSDD
jgi:nitrite reductase (NADH) small subunit